MHRDATKNPGRTLATWACCLITGACSGTVLDPEAILAEAPPRTASSTVAMSCIAWASTFALTK